MIRSLLIANRGEIARRIIRTCRRLGVRPVAVYSDADANSLYVEEADAAVHVGAAPASQSYLSIPAIVSAARRMSADAIHPGYGFLAENADFAHACRAAGLVFVGPSAAAIAAMGDKRAARAIATRHGVPVIPGYDGPEQSDAVLAREAERLGFPVMVKAAAGGGGKGMRLAHDATELLEALTTARREAGAAFGSDSLLLERALTRPRHVEIQVLGDQHGRIIHLGERECSIQRRHQKVIEESPSPAVDDALRARMGAAAVQLAAAVEYSGAGTVEFLLDGEGEFYFLEMNTRLQVEHPITELVTGIDLVEWQIRIAEGEALPWAQDAIRLAGHAVEARLYAEDPATGFLPVTGQVLLWRPPAGDGVRVDDGIRSGDSVTVHYDPMLAKVVAFGRDRPDTLRRLSRALETTVLLGLTTNLPHLVALVAHPAFIAGDLSTQFVDEHAGRLSLPPDDEAVTTAAIAAAVMEWRRAGGGNPSHWRNNPADPAHFLFQWDSATIEVWLASESRRPDCYEVRLSSSPEQHRSVQFNGFAAPDLSLTIDGLRRRITLAERRGEWWVKVDANSLCLEALSLLPEPHRRADAGGSLRAPMPGTVLAVLVEVGQAVVEGQPLLKLEAMKMEHTIRTAAAGIVTAVYYAPGDPVEADALLLRVSET